MIYNTAADSGADRPPWIPGRKGFWGKARGTFLELSGSEPGAGTEGGNPRQLGRKQDPAYQ